MLGASQKSNWPLLVFYTIVLVIGFMVSVFLVALYWSVGDISRVEPRAADYRADYNSSGQISLFPISTQVVVSARLDHDGVFPDPLLEPSPVEESPTVTSTLVEGSEGTSTPTMTATSTATSASVTPSPSPTNTQSSTPTPSPSSTLTRAVSITPKPTNPKPSDTPDKPKPTNPPQPTNTSAPPQPTSTQSIPSPRPTQPPPPTATQDSYPPPRPTDPATAYP